MGKTQTVIYACMICGYYVPHILEVKISKMDGTKTSFYDKICLGCLTNIINNLEKSLLDEQNNLGMGRQTSTMETCKNKIETNMFNEEHSLKMMLEAKDLYSENQKLWAAINLIAAQCGLPDPADACRAILATIKELEGEV
jgi:hypothetical protein